MGLTLYFDLRLPPDTPRSTVAALLSELRGRALALDTPMALVSPMFDLSVDDDTAPDDDSRSARLFLNFCADCLGDPPRMDEIPYATGDPRSALGFIVHPGQGAEMATFALMRRQAESDGAEEWFWWCACKTQYASTVSEEHFVAVHTSLVKILDHAANLGFDVQVRDEGGYWESRSTSVLLDEVRGMNRLMARFAGTLSDAIGDEHEIKAPIFGHPQFERLEMEE